MMKTSISGLLIVLVLQMTIAPATVASPFLYNAAPLFLQSIFRLSAGIPDNGSTQNVEDLRHSDEPTKLENVKAARRHFAANQQAATAEDGNEAAPNFVQKKIDKILHKLKLITQLSGPFVQFGGGPPTQHDNREPDDFDFDFDSDERNDTGRGNVNGTTATEAVRRRPQRFSLHLATPRLQNNAEAEPAGNDLTSNNNVSEANSNRVVNPGAIGVFLIEMLGTVLTLIYGAAVQHNNENNTAPALI